MARLPHLPATPALVSAIREWSGWFVVAAGAVLCVLGWYGVSGESVIEQQLPYLASATIPGAAMIVAGVMLLASRPARRTGQADERIETLYALLVADTDAAPAVSHQAVDDAQALLAVPGGTLYHRRDCPLVVDKPTAEVIDAAAVVERSLTPCPVCEPPTLPPGDAGGSDPGQPVGGPDRPGHAAAAQPAAAPDEPGSARGQSPSAPDRPGHAPDHPTDPDQAAP